MLSVQVILEHKGRAVHHVAPGATVYDALTAMAKHNCGALLVLDGERAVGMLSERDYARKVILMGRLSKETPVSDIMERTVISVPVDASIDTCMAIMTERRTRHVVVRDCEEIVGVISIGDVVKAVIDDQRVTIEQLQHYITASI